MFSQALEYVYIGQWEMKIPQFIMLNSVCHKIVLVKGGGANADKGRQRGDEGDEDDEENEEDEEDKAY